MCNNIRLNSGDVINPNAFLHKIFPGALPRGFIKAENINTTWAGRILGRISVPVAAVYEKNTKGFIHNGQKPPGLWFRLSDGKGVEVAIVKGFSGRTEARIVTVDAKTAKGKSNPALVHHRFPKIVDVKQEG